MYQKKMTKANTFGDASAMLIDLDDTSANAAGGMPADDVSAIPPGGASVDDSLSLASGDYDRR